jgi:hypothetical protein
MFGKTASFLKMLSQNVMWDEVKPEDATIFGSFRLSHPKLCESIFLGLYR